MKNNKLDLGKLNLKTFTKQDVIDYCQINNININTVEELYLENNEPTDISGVKLFKNLKELYLYNNKLTDISVIENLKDLEVLGLGKNYLKDISSVQYLKNLIVLGIEDLKLESDQIEYIINIKKIFYKNAFKDMKIIKKLKNK